MRSIVINLIIVFLFFNNGLLFSQLDNPTNKGERNDLLKKYFICKCLSFGFNNDSIFQIDHSPGLYLEELGLEYEEKRMIDSIARNIADSIPVSNYTNKKGVFASCFDYAEKLFDVISASQNEVCYKQTGYGSTQLELIIKDGIGFVEVTYEFFSEPDELVIYDQLGNVLYRSGMRTTKRPVVINISLIGCEKLVFNIHTKSSKSKWVYDLKFDNVK